MKKRIVRFEIQDLLPIGLTLVVAGIGIVYGMSVMGDIKSDECNQAYEHYTNGQCYVCPVNGSHNIWIPSITRCTNQTNYANASNITAPQGGSAAYNGSANAIKGIAKIPEKMPLIATVIIAAIIIGILVRYLMVRFT